MIRHTVSFRLHHAPGSTREIDFLRAADRLRTIPGVQAFECLRQVSPKNGFAFGLSMEFEDAAAYAGYNEHPLHVDFVQTRWIPEVAEFLEIDYVPYNLDGEEDAGP
jgi:hypothetical protein